MFEYKKTAALNPSAPTDGMRAVVFSFPVIALTSGNLEAVELLLEILGRAFSGYGQIALGF